MAKLIQPEIKDFFNGLCCNSTPPVLTPPTIDYTQTSFTFTQGTAVNICPATLSGSPTIVVTVSPSLPPNLVLNPSTGCITGIPSGTSSPANYTFTATNSVGTDTDSINIEVDSLVITTCYSKTTQSDLFTAQSSFPAKIALTGTGALQETVYNNTYVSGAEADGQYSLRNGSGNDQNGSSSSYGIAFNFAIQGSFVPNKIYSQKLIGTAGDLYKGGIWARERSSGVKAQFAIKVYDGATLLASGLTGSISNTYTNYKTNSFTMPASGEVTIEVWNQLNGNASGNDPVLDGIGLARVTSTTALYKKITTNGVDAYFDSNMNPITGAALTQLQSDISSGAAVVVSCLPIVQTPPTIEYTDTTLTFTEGTAVNICPATLTGDPTIVVTVSPSLPTGLSLNPATGCITGTPTGSSVATNYTFTATNSVGTDTDSINVTVDAVTPPATLWIVETTTTTKDLKALYPTATAFEFKIVGAGGGGCGTYTRQINTQSSNNNAGGSGGGYTNITIPASSFTAPATLEVGLGGAGGLSSVAVQQWGFAGMPGGASSVKIGAIVLADAKGGNEGGFGSTKWGLGGVGLTLNGGQAANITGISGFHGTSSASRGIGTSPAPMPTGTSTGAGGAFAGFTTSTAIRIGQVGQNASTGAIGGATGATNVNDVILGAGAKGGDGAALTDGTLLFGAGGGSGGMGSNNNQGGGNGGSGGFPGGGGGAAGPATLKVNTGVGGAGANGVLMWRPIF